MGRNTGRAASAGVEELPPQDQLEDGFPESWAPAKNPDQARTLVGEITGYELGPDLGYGQHWIATVVDTTGKEWSVWLFQSVLLSEFEEKRPMPGERVTIRYLGMQDKPKGDGPAYHRFRLTVDRGPLPLPAFLTAPQLDAGAPALAVVDSPAPTTVDVPDADVIEEDVPF